MPNPWSKEEQERIDGIGASAMTVREQEHRESVHDDLDTNTGEAPQESGMGAEAAKQREDEMLADAHKAIPAESPSTVYSEGVDPAEAQRQFNEKLQNGYFSAIANREIPDTGDVDMDAFSVRAMRVAAAENGKELPPDEELMPPKKEEEPVDPAEEGDAISQEEAEQSVEVAKTSVDVIRDSAEQIMDIVKELGDSVEELSDAPTEENLEMAEEMDAGMLPGEDTQADEQRPAAAAASKEGSIADSSTPKAEGEDEEALKDGTKGRADEGGKLVKKKLTDKAGKVKAADDEQEGDGIDRETLNAAIEKAKANVEKWAKTDKGLRTYYDELMKWVKENPGKDISNYDIEVGGFAFERLGDTDDIVKEWGDGSIGSEDEFYLELADDIVKEIGDAMPVGYFVNWNDGSAYIVATPEKVIELVEGRPYNPDQTTIEDMAPKAVKAIRAYASMHRRIDDADFGKVCAGLGVTVESGKKVLAANYYRKKEPMGALYHKIKDFVRNLVKDKEQAKVMWQDDKDSIYNEVADFVTEENGATNPNMTWVKRMTDHALRNLGTTATKVKVEGGGAAPDKTTASLRKDYLALTAQKMPHAEAIRVVASLYGVEAKKAERVVAEETVSSIEPIKMNIDEEGISVAAKRNAKASLSPKLYAVGLGANNRGGVDKIVEGLNAVFQKMKKANPKGFMDEFESRFSTLLWDVAQGVGANSMDQHEDTYVVSFDSKLPAKQAMQDVLAAETRGDFGPKAQGQKTVASDLGWTAEQLPKVKELEALQDSIRGINLRELSNEEFDKLKKTNDRITQLMDELYEFKGLSGKGKKDDDDKPEGGKKNPFEKPKAPKKDDDDNDRDDTRSIYSKGRRKIKKLLCESELDDDPDVSIVQTRFWDEYPENKVLGADGSLDGYYMVVKDGDSVIAIYNDGAGEKTKKEAKDALSAGRIDHDSSSYEDTDDRDDTGGSTYPSMKKSERDRAIREGRIDADKKRGGERNRPFAHSRVAERRASAGLMDGKQVKWDIYYAGKKKKSMLFPPSFDKGQVVDTLVEKYGYHPDTTVKKAEDQTVRSQRSATATMTREEAINVLRPYAGDLLGKHYRGDRNDNKKVVDAVHALIPNFEWPDWDKEKIGDILKKVTARRSATAAPYYSISDGMTEMKGTIDIYPGLKIPYGGSSSPDPIYVTRVENGKVYFKHWPYTPEARETWEDEQAFKYTAEKSLKNGIKNYEHYLKTAAGNANPLIIKRVQDYKDLLANKKISEGETYRPDPEALSRYDLIVKVKEGADLSDVRNHDAWYLMEEFGVGDVSGLKDGTYRLGGLRPSDIAELEADGRLEIVEKKRDTSGGRTTAMKTVAAARTEDEIRKDIRDLRRRSFDDGANEEEIKQQLSEKKNELNALLGGRILEDSFEPKIEKVTPTMYRIGFNYKTEKSDTPRYVEAREYIVRRTNDGRWDDRYGYIGDMAGLRQKWVGIARDAFDAFVKEENAKVEKHLAPVAQKVRAENTAALDELREIQNWFSKNPIKDMPTDTYKKMSGEIKKKSDRMRELMAVLYDETPLRQAATATADEYYRVKGIPKGFKESRLIGGSPSKDAASQIAKEAEESGATSVIIERMEGGKVVAVKAGDELEHPRFGKVRIDHIDDKTYSIPMAVFEVLDGNLKGEKIIRPAGEFSATASKKKPSGIDVRQSKGKWEVVDRNDNDKILGTHDTEEKAREQQKAIYASMNREAKAEKTATAAANPIDIGDGYYAHKIGYDRNGNWAVWVSKGANPALKIQTNGEAPEAHRARGKYRDLAEAVAALSDRARDELKDYHKRFGAKAVVKKEGGDARPPFPAR